MEAMTFSANLVFPTGTSTSFCEAQKIEWALRHEYFHDIFPGGRIQFERCDFEELTLPYHRVPFQITVHCEKSTPPNCCVNIAFYEATFKLWIAEQFENLCYEFKDVSVTPHHLIRDDIFDIEMPFSMLLAK